MAADAIGQIGQHDRLGGDGAATVVVRDNDHLQRRRTGRRTDAEDTVDWLRNPLVFELGHVGDDVIAHRIEPVCAEATASRAKSPTSGKKGFRVMRLRL